MKNKIIKDNMISIIIKVIINTTTTQRNNHNYESLRAIKLEKQLRKKRIT